jgi:hypothetical protein
MTFHVIHPKFEKCAVRAARAELNDRNSGNVTSPCNYGNSEKNTMLLQQGNYLTVQGISARFVNKNQVLIGFSFRAKSRCSEIAQLWAV